MVDVVKTEMAAIRQANNYHRDMAVQEMCIYNLRRNYDKSMILQSITGFSGTPPDMIRYFLEMINMFKTIMATSVSYSFCWNGYRWTALMAIICFLDTVC